MRLLKVTKNILYHHVNTSFYCLSPKTKRRGMYVSKMEVLIGSIYLDVICGLSTMGFCPVC